MIRRKLTRKKSYKLQRHMTMVMKPEQHQLHENLKAGQKSYKVYATNQALPTFFLKKEAGAPPFIAKFLFE
jgi:hypothetical protein